MKPSSTSSTAKASSREGDVLDMAVANNIVEKSGAWYSYSGERIGQGRDVVRPLLQIARPRGRGVTDPRPVHRDETHPQRLRNRIVGMHARRGHRKTAEKEDRPPLRIAAIEESQKPAVR